MPGFRMKMECWKVSIPVGGLLAVVLAVGLPAAAEAQTSGDEDGTSDGVEPAIEWNFQPRGVPHGVAEEDLEARWAAPFAVVSRGSTEARDTRKVVIVRGRPELVAADSGETAAIVVVEEGEGLGRIGRLAQNVDTATAEGGGEETERPAVEEEAETPAVDEEGEVPAVAEEEEEETERIHTVVRGDTLYGIARRYGVSAAAIRGANGLEGDVVRLGETLLIPEEETSR